jgi:hypothetical protein
MDRVKDMQANEHGRYTEIMNEKEVIRTSAWVLRVCVECEVYFLPLMSLCTERNHDVWFISTTQTSNGARSWTNIWRYAPPPHTHRVVVNDRDIHRNWPQNTSRHGLFAYSWRMCHGSWRNSWLKYYRVWCALWTVCRKIGDYFDYLGNGMVLTAWGYLG